jgi:hypothetical protein
VRHVGDYRARLAQRPTGRPSQACPPGSLMRSSEQHFSRSTAEWAGGGVRDTVYGSDGCRRMVVCSASMA